MRRAALVGALVVLASACAEVGADIPSCEQPGNDVRVSIILAAQAVPTAEWGPCLNELKAGWSYDQLEAESGRARLRLSSDRLGADFLTITLEERCEPGASEPEESGVPGVERRVDVRAGTSGPVEITLVPATEAEAAHAANLVLHNAGLYLKERPVAWSVDDRVVPLATRVDEALAQDRYVIIVSPSTSRAGEYRLRTRARADIPPQKLDDVLDEIRAELDVPAYRATWYHLFQGGCIVYEFSARGVGIEHLQSDIADVVGFISLGDLRRASAESGLLLSELQPG